MAADVTDEAAVGAADRGRRQRFGGVDLVVEQRRHRRRRASLVDTTVAELGPAARRPGPRLVPGGPGTPPASMIAQGLGGDIVYIVSKNAVVAGPKNLAYGAAKADQAHQVRLLAAELGDARHPRQRREPRRRRAGLRASSSGEWLEQRASVYGVAPQDLGEFYASRTLLGREVLPEHVAERRGVRCVSGGLSRAPPALLIPGRRRRCRAGLSSGKEDRTMRIDRGP